MVERPGEPRFALACADGSSSRGVGGSMSSITLDWGKMGSNGVGSSDQSKDVLVRKEGSFASANEGTLDSEIGVSFDSKISGAFLRASNGCFSDIVFSGASDVG